LEKQEKQQLSQKDLEQAEIKFFEILEEFNKRTDNKGFNSFMSDAIARYYDDNEMLIISCCELLMQYGDQRYKEHLNKLGIEGTEEEIKRYIAQIKSKYEIDRENESAKNKNKGDDDFHTSWAFAFEQIGYFPSDVLLPDWCGIINVIKRKSEISEKLNRNGRRIT
jgi:hypothetical protein